MPRPESAVAAAHGLEVEEIRNLRELEGMRQEWSRLCDRCPWSTPFQRPEWLLPWSRAFPPWEPRVLAVRGEGRLAGLLPLFLWDDGGRKTLSLFGAGPSDRLDLVAEPEGEQEAAAAAFEHLAASGGWEVCDLDGLALESPLLSCPLPAGWREEVAPREPCPVLSLPGTVAGLEEVVPRRQRYNLRQYRRRAERQGGIELRAAGAEDWRELWEALVRMHRQRWGDEGVLADLAMRELHRQVIPGFLHRGELALYGLWLGGRLAAVHYGFYDKGTAYCYLHGFEPEWERQSPGVLLIGGVIEAAVRRGATAFDFLRGGEPYKYRWGARDRAAARRRLQPAR